VIGFALDIRGGVGPLFEKDPSPVFTKLFNPDSTMVRLDQTDAERLRHVFAADRLLRRERTGWGDSSSAWSQLVLKIRAACGL
jgi:hypothetical protein